GSDPAGGLTRTPTRRADGAADGRPLMDWVLALDAGTTGVRTLAVGADGRPGPMAYREFPQLFPRPGWVEHDADDILAAARATLGEVAAAVHDAGGAVAAMGITNQ